MSGGCFDSPSPLDEPTALAVTGTCNFPFPERKFLKSRDYGPLGKVLASMIARVDRSMF